MIETKLNFFDCQSAVEELENLKLTNPLFNFDFEIVEDDNDCDNTTCMIELRRNKEVEAILIHLSSDWQLIVFDDYFDPSNTLDSEKEYNYKPTATEAVQQYISELEDYAKFAEMELAQSKSILNEEYAVLSIDNLVNNK